MTIRSGKPSQMTAAEKAAFVDFVATAGEVSAATLSGLVENAAALVLLFDDDKLIGTAGIKVPFPGHQQGEFAKASVAARANDFPLELGWVVVHPEYRKRGHAGELVLEASRLAAGAGIYATKKTPRMLAILAENGFETIGEPYPSLLNPDVKLILLGKRGDST
jgi:GNAT superfamily N-acetyltransferase